MPFWQPIAAGVPAVMRFAGPALSPGALNRIPVTSDRGRDIQPNKVPDMRLCDVSGNDWSVPATGPFRHGGSRPHFEPLPIRSFEEVAYPLPERGRPMLARNGRRYLVERWDARENVTTETVKTHMRRNITASQGSRRQPARTIGAC